MIFLNDFLILIANLFVLFTFLCSVLVIISKNPIHSVLFLILIFFNVSGLFFLIGMEFIALIMLVVYIGAIAVLFLFVVMLLDIKIDIFYQNFKNYNYFLVFLILIVFAIVNEINSVFFVDLQNLSLIRMSTSALSTIIDNSTIFNFLNTAYFKQTQFLFFNQFLNTYYIHNYQTFTDLSNAFLCLISDFEVYNVLSLKKPLLWDLFVTKINNNSIKPTTNVYFQTFEVDTIMNNNGFYTKSVTDLGKIGHFLFTSFSFHFIVASMSLLIAMIGSINLTLEFKFNLRKQEIFEQVTRNNVLRLYS